MNSIQLVKKVSSARSLFHRSVWCSTSLLILLAFGSTTSSLRPANGQDAPSIIAAVVIVNPSFEAVQIGPPFVSSNPVDVPGWTHAGVGEGPLWAVGYTDGQGSVTVAGDGNQFVTLGGGFSVVGFASWAQTISGFVPGASYRLSFLMATEGESSSQTLSVSFPPDIHMKSFTSGPSTALYWRNWEPKRLVFVPTASTVTVQFSANIQYDVGLDKVQIQRIR
jgi:Protein of unknown function (DUF642)